MRRSRQNLCHDLEPGRFSKRYRIASNLPLALHSERSNGTSAAANNFVSDRFMFDVNLRSMEVQQRKRRIY